MADTGRLAALALLAAGLLLPGLLTGPSLDAAVFVHAAGEVRDGALLYVDVWDHKPPGAILLLASIQWLLPFVDPWLLAWLLSVLVTALAGWVIGRILVAVGVRATAAWLAAGAAVIVMGQYLTALGGGLTEPLATALLAAAALLAIRHGAPAHRLAVGALVATALLVSVPAGAGVLVLAFLAVLRAERRGRAALLVASGMVVPVAVIGAGLSATGALGPAIEAVVGYSAAYRASNAATGGELSAPVASWTLLALLFLLVPALIGTIPSLRGDHTQRWLVIACGAWLAFSLVLFVSQGRFFAHYAIPLAIPLGILGGLGLDRLLARGLPRRPAARLMRLAPLAIAALISAAASTVAGGMEWTSVARQHDRVDAVAAAVRELTDPDDRIWAWGTAPQLYLAADRATATRYAYLYPLVTPGYTTPAMVEATRVHLEADPPALIVDAGSSAPGAPGFLPLLIPRPIASDGRDLDLLDPLRAFVRDRYTELETVDGWVIYRLRP